MATAKKLPSGSWRCQIYDYTDKSGKRHYKSFTCDDTTSRGKRRAELMASEYAASKELATHSDTKISMSAAMQSYIDSKQHILSPATIVGYTNIRKLFDSEFKTFARKNIFSVTQSDIQTVIDLSCADSSPKTVRNRHGLIASTIKKYRPEMALNTTLPQKVRPNLHIPTDEEVALLLDAVRGTEMEVPVMLGAFGPLRRSEICALTMDDLDGNTLHVCKALVKDTTGTYHIKPPKTYGSDRYISLPPFVSDLIRSRGSYTAYVPDTITKNLAIVLDKNNIPHFRFHDLRHYCASIQHALGIPDAYIMERGGWSSDSVLKSIYRHSMTDRQAQMNDIANEHFETLQHEMQHDDL